MAGPLKPSSLAVFRALTQGAALASVCLPLVVLVGWALEASWLPLWGAGRPPMAPNTAVGLILLGVALWSLSPERPTHPGRRALGRLCAAGAFLIGALTLVEYATDRSLGMDGLLFQWMQWARNTPPPRPSLDSALSLVLFGASLVLLEHPPLARVPWTDALALPVLLIGLLVTNAYVHGGLAHLDEPQLFAHAGMGLMTALLLVLLGVGILCARPRRGLASRLARDSLGGVAARRLVPLALLGPLLVSALLKLLTTSGALGAEAKLPLFSTVASVGGMALVLLVAHGLDALDAERQRASAAHAASEARLRAVLEQAPLGILVLDVAVDEVFANTALQELLGRPVRPEAGRSQFIPLLRHLDGRALSLETLPSTRASAGEVVPAEEYLLVRADGHTVPVLASAAPVRGPSGEVLNVIATLQDITARRELERLREEYVDLISHDLRNPLNNISLRAQMLERALRDQALPREHALVEALQQSARRMGGMIEELLESARFESGRVELRREPMDLVRYLEEVLERDVPPAERERFTLEVAGAMPEVSADPARLERVLVNLLTNALKYTPPGTPVTVRLARADGRLVVSVKDTGPGLKPEEQAHLFEKFYRTRSGRKAEGLGLGLYISRLIIEAHGGRIWVESTPGKGATFSFTLPEEAPRAAEAPRPDTQAGVSPGSG